MWGALDISPQGCLRTRCGDLIVYIRRVDDEWLFSHSLEPEESGESAVSAVPQEALPVDLDWLRLVSARDEILELVPALPDRPLVIRPETRISIFTGRYALFYVAIPVWLRFVAVRGKERIDVIDVPTRTLSNTWFGDPANGELCYSLDAPLKRNHDQLGKGLSTVVCSLVVRNGSEEKLNFERICVHVENLSVFESQGELWTNEIKVLFKGSDQISQISIQRAPPELAEKPRKLTAPRLDPSKNVLKRSFTLFRQFTGI